MPPVTRRGGGGGEHTGGVRAAVADAFLPAGYPHSVREDYLGYQVFDSGQAIASSIMGIFSSRAMLRAVGVGDGLATATSAAWVYTLRDISARVGQIVYASQYASHFDTDTKTYRFVADWLNDAGLALELLCSFFASMPLVVIPLACLASVARALCGVAAGATKAALSVHFCLDNNLGDVAAKDASQENLVSLTGSLLGMAVTSLVPEDALWVNLVCFLVLMGVHLALNYCAVRRVVMVHLNRQRLNIVLGSPAGAAVPSPGEVAQRERIAYFGESGEPRVVLGASVEECGLGDLDFEALKRQYAGRPYLLHRTDDGATVSVLFVGRAATPVAALEAYIEARTGARMRQGFVEQLRDAGWDVDWFALGHTELWVEQE